MNKVVLVGRLTRDPEIRTMPNGNQVASFTLAINRNFKNKDGNIDADFINVSIFGRQAENVGKYVSKGSLVGCDGRIQTRSYDAQDGTKRYVTEVVCENVNFLSSKNASEENRNDYQPQSNYEPSDTSDMGNNSSMEMADLTEDPFKSFSEEITLTNDDLPF